MTDEALAFSATIRLDRNRRAFIFGAGRGGEIVFDRLSRPAGPQVAAFVDNRAQGTLRGLPILSADELTRRLRPGDVVVIASQHRDEIRAQLEAAGVDCVLDGGDLIDEVLCAEARARDPLRHRLETTTSQGVATHTLVRPSSPG